MLRCYDLLNLLAPSIDAVGDALFAKQHISRDVRDTLRMDSMKPIDKVRKVIDCVTDRVEHIPRVYKEFVVILEKKGAKSLADELNTYYHRPSNASVPVESRHMTGFLDAIPSLLTLETEQPTGTATRDMTTPSDTELVHPSTAPPLGHTSTQTEDTLQLESYGFRCPHCALCTVDEFLSEKGCPKASNKDPQMFPFLDTSGLSEGDKINLEHRLKSETRKIICSFADLTRSTKRSLECQKVDVEDLATSLLVLEAFKAGIAKKPLLKEDETNIKEASSIADIFLILTDYISFFNYEIIEHIVKDFGTEDDHKSLAEYIAAFNDFCRRSVFEVPCHVLGTAPTSSSKFRTFAVKYSEDAHHTMENAKLLQRKIADLFNITPCALQLVSIVRGCMQLQFSLPAIIAEQILPPSPSQLKNLRTLSVRMIVEPEVSNEDDQQK